MARILTIIYLTIFMGCTASKKSLIALDQKLMPLIHESGARIGIAFKDMQTGKTLLINEKQSFHAASTMKVPVLIELYKQAARAKISLTDSLPIQNEFKSMVDGSPYSLHKEDDSEQGLYEKNGQKESVYNLAYTMIINSSNLATNTLIQNVGADNVMATMKNLGARDIKVLRGVEDQKAYEKGMNNTTTAYDLMFLFDKLAKHEIISRSASENMISILLDQKFNNIIPALLPNNIKVAHKTGSIDGIQHDAGIIYLPDGRKYVLVLLSQFDPKQTDMVVKKLGQVSRIIYDFMASNH